MDYIRYELYVCVCGTMPGRHEANQRTTFSCPLSNLRNLIYGSPLRCAAANPGRSENIICTAAFNEFNNPLSLSCETFVYFGLERTLLVAISREGKKIVVYLIARRQRETLTFLFEGISEKRAYSPPLKWIKRLYKARHNKIDSTAINR